MSLFLFAYVSTYSAMSGYAYCRLLPLLPDSRFLRIGLAVILMVMVPAPILIRIMERSGLESGLTSGGLLVFSWMGFLFLVVAVSLFFDFLRLLAWFVGRIWLGDGSNFMFSPQLVSRVTLALVMILFSYGLFEARDLRQEHVVLATAKLPPGVDRLRIVQVSDVHLGLLLGEKTLGRIVKAVREAEPDLLVSTGDLVDSSPKKLAREAEMWDDLQPRLGKVAVTGNHEFYAGIEDSIRFTEQAGFVLLRDAIFVAGPVTVIGLDDRNSFSGQEDPRKKQRVELSENEAQRFILLLKHRPGLSALFVGRADLQLSGHTHQGQIFPFGLFTRMAFPYPGGLSGDTGEWLYVSRGTGTWGPPIRLFSPPEITIIDLISEAAAKDRYVLDSWGKKTE